MATRRPRIRQEVVARALGRFARPGAGGEPGLWLVESLACGHEIAFDLEGGWYKGAGVRMCAVCAGKAAGSCEFRVVTPYSG